MFISADLLTFTNGVTDKESFLFANYNFKVNIMTTLESICLEEQKYIVKV